MQYTTIKSELIISKAFSITLFRRSLSLTVEEWDISPIKMSYSFGKAVCQVPQRRVIMIGA